MSGSPIRTPLLWAAVWVAALFLVIAPVASLHAAAAHLEASGAAASLAHPAPGPEAAAALGLYRTKIALLVAWFWLEVFIVLAVWTLVRRLEAAAGARPPPSRAVRAAVAAASVAALLGLVAWSLRPVPADALSSAWAYARARHVGLGSPWLAVLGAYVFVEGVGAVLLWRAFLLLRPAEAGTVRRSAAAAAAAVLVAVGAAAAWSLPAGGAASPDAGSALRNLVFAWVRLDSVAWIAVEGGAAMVALFAAVEARRLLRRPSA